ncbi:MAG: DUF4860 domain-containing protein [Acetivibrionales bacterium]|jgi:hypothetical protein
MKEVLYNNGISFKQENGRTLIETISVLLILILLGVGCFSLSLSAFGAYQRLNDSKEKINELRVASSFIMNKIRRNDVNGGLDVKAHPVTSNNALVIYENIDGEEYETWIYHSSGYLMEALVLKDEEPSADVSQIIAKIDSFEIEYDSVDHKIFTSVGIDGRKPYNNTIKIRTK